MTPVLGAWALSFRQRGFVEDFGSGPPSELPDVYLAICAKWVRNRGDRWGLEDSRRVPIESLALVHGGAEAGLVGKVGLLAEG